MAKTLNVVLLRLALLLAFLHLAEDHNAKRNMLAIRLLACLLLALLAWNLALLAWQHSAAGLRLRLLLARAHGKHRSSLHGGSH